MKTIEEKRASNRAKMAAYRARNPEKSRAQSREALRRMRERMRTAGIPRPIEPKRLAAKLAKALAPKPAKAPKPTKPAAPGRDIKAERAELLRERFNAWRSKQKAAA